MKAYMMHDGEPCEGAALVFANSWREARTLAFNKAACCEMCEFIEVRGNRLKYDKWLKEHAADKEKLAAGIPHVIDSPPCCNGCDNWHDWLDDNGYCESCADDMEA